MNIAERIREAREKKGLTQKELGAKLGVTREAIWHWEAGKAMPGGTALLKLMEILDLTLVDLAGKCHKCRKK